MKKLISTLIGVLMTLTLLAQAPLSFNYQAVLRDNNGEVRANQSVKITLSLLQGSVEGAALYTEEHDIQTNAFGLIILQVGQGTSSDDLSALDWAKGSYFIRVAVDGTEMGTTQMLSVPYALYAEEAGNVFSGSFKDLTDVPLVFDTANSFKGSFDELADIPENLDTDSTDDFSGDYNDLINKPEIPVAGEQVFSKNDSVVFITEQKVGIGTEAARGRLEVFNGGVVFAGDSGTVEIAGAGTRLMWIPEKAAFRAGKVFEAQWDIDSIGTASIAIGINTKASGNFSTALGSNTVASGEFSTALGLSTVASGESSTALGEKTEASGFFSTAMGDRAKASGGASTAMGNSTEAIGNGSIAMGRDTKAIGDGSTAMGFSTEANKDFSTAMGENTNASGISSTAMGSGTQASGDGSTAMGSGAQASGFFSTAMGNSTEAGGDFSTAMGGATKASGQFSTAMGRLTVASGDFSTALGDSTIASEDFSTAMGRLTVASGDASTAMGNRTKASGIVSTAMGSSTEASGVVSTAMGEETAARGNRSTAIGNKAKANHDGVVVIAANKNVSLSDSIASSADEQMVLRADGNFFFCNDKVTVPNEPDKLINTSTGAFLSTGGAWTNASDRNLKENFIPIHAASLLENIKALEVTTWNYKTESDSTTHIGPMAQDFYRIYGLGQDDTSISTVDGIGVALATIKALQAENEAIKKENKQIKELLAQQKQTMEARVSALETMLQQLTLHD